jgi:hypothetical protein
VEINCLAYKYIASCSELKTPYPNFDPATVPSPLEDKLEDFQLKIEFRFHFYFEVETPRIQAILSSNSLLASF